MDLQKYLKLHTPVKKNQFVADYPPTESKNKRWIKILKCWNTPESNQGNQNLETLDSRVKEN